MRADVARFDLRIRRRAAIGYVVGIALYTLVIVALYPAMRRTTGLDELTKGNNPVAALFGAVGSLTSPAGWLNANLFANFAPLIILVVTIGYGASCIAGQNEEDTLSLVATQPLTRRTILVQKVGALCVQATLVAVATGLAVTVGRLFQLPVPIGHVAAAVAGQLLLGIDVGLVALGIGAWTGSRGTALGLASALATVSYVVGAMAPVVSWLRPVRPLSIFYWAVADNQLTNGLSVSSWVVLVGVGVALFALALVAFERLEIR